MSGRLTVNGLELHHAGGGPLQGGDIEPGTTVSFNPFTGELAESFDLTEWVSDQIVGWNIVERTRWEGEGGLIPPESFWP